MSDIEKDSVRNKKILTALALFALPVVLVIYNVLFAFLRQGSEVSTLVQASLFNIGISGILIIVGIVLIKRGYRTQHKFAMLTACLFAFIFLILYVTRAVMFPPTKYMGDYRTLYFTILWSHTFLASLNLPMAIVTVFLGLKGKFETHKKIAPYTAGVWIYVAVTGWMIFGFLK
jgi:putative membrane protein